jgi:hypothetical protein
MHRKDLQKAKNQKKRTSDNYSNKIKKTKDSDAKCSYRQSKINAENYYVNQI